MDFLEDLVNRYKKIANDSAGAGQDQPEQPPAQPEPASPAIEAARRQLEATERNTYREIAPGVFCGNGVRWGVGYAEAFATVDEASGTASVVIHSNLFVCEHNISMMRKIFRRLNEGFIVPGLAVSDEGEVLYVAARPCRLLAGDDVADFLSKGFSTLSAHAHMVAQIEAGRNPLEVLHSNDEDD